MCSAYDEDTVSGEKRSVLRFHPAIAPIKVAILPLMKNKEEIMAKSTEIFKKLQMRYNVVFDAAGNIGRRYRRMDEVGTPFCVTIDFDSREDNTVTVRQRDSTEQARMNIDELYTYLAKEIEGF